MNHNVSGAMPGFGIKELKGILGSWQMAVHAVGHETLLVVHMGWSLPGIIGEADLVADGTELWCWCADHGVVGEAEERKGNEYAYDNENGGLDNLFQCGTY